MDNGENHECELFREGGFKTAESGSKWRNCRKNKGHINFISAKDFKDNHLSKVQDPKSFEALRSWVDLTVRLKVDYTSRDRPEDDEFAFARGTTLCRTGTGFIENVCRVDSDNCYLLGARDGEQRQKHWRFDVGTARHVVYNTEEAEKTKVDLFLDDESCEENGTVKSLMGVKVVWSYPDRDMVRIQCVTYDTDLGERIESARHCCDNTRRALDLSGLDFLPSCNTDRPIAMIVSHPHGQPKKITVGEVRETNESRPISYTVPTCPGCSGAPVFRFKAENKHALNKSVDVYIFLPVHSGSYNITPIEGEDQLNFGYFSFI